MHGLLAALLLSSVALANSGRPHYPGPKHTTSHHGKYAGGHGRSHKNGKYKGPTGYNGYGIHK